MIPINMAIAECGAFKIHKATGMRVGLLALPGLVFTDIDAVKKLTGAEAIPVTMGSSEGECASTLIIKGFPKRGRGTLEAYKRNKGRTKDQS